MKRKANNLQFELRSGTVDDIPLLLAFIHKMAEFEKLEVTTTEEILKESLFGENPAAQTLFAFVDGKPAAYAIYFFSFSSMVGKRGLWLDDLYVDPAFRGRGIAKSIMAYLANIAINNNCARFEWIVIDWNKAAMNFYQGLGATVLDGWRICRVEERNLYSIAERHVVIENCD